MGSLALGPAVRGRTSCWKNVAEQGCSPHGGQEAERQTVQIQEHGYPSVKHSQWFNSFNQVLSPSCPLSSEFINRFTHQEVKLVMEGPLLKSALAKQLGFNKWAFEQTFLCFQIIALQIQIQGFLFVSQPLFRSKPSLPLLFWMTADFYLPLVSMSPAF